MAVSIDLTGYLTELWDADSTATWTYDGDGSPSGSLFTDRQREGTSCLGFQVSNGTEMGYRTFTSFNMSSARLYMWMYSTGYLDTQANGGFRIGVGDGTNRRYYYVGGSDFFGHQVGAWSCFVLDPSNLPTSYYQAAGSAAPDFSAITQVGWGNKTLAKSLGGAENFFLDVTRWGTGIRVEGGGSSTQGTWAEIAADDASKSASKAYGVVRQLAAGVYGLQGDVIFGDNGTGDSYFFDTDSIVIVEDNGNENILLQLSGNSTGTNSFVNGIKVGTGDTAKGRNGVTYLSAGPAFEIDLDDSNMDEVEVYGSKFQQVSTFTLPTDTAAEFIGNTVDQCAMVTVNQCIVRGCVFSNTLPVSGAHSAAVLYNSTWNVKNSEFLANSDPDGTYRGHGVKHTAAASLSYYDLLFTNNEYDIWFSAASGDLTIGMQGTSNASTYTNDSTGTVSLINTVTVKVTALDASTLSEVQGARVALLADTGGTLPSGASVTITSSGGTATVAHTSHGLSTGDKVSIKGANEQQYNCIATITVTGASSYTYSIDDSPASPATGTITATSVILDGTTDVNGEIADTSFNYAGSQPVFGKVRKGTTAPRYKEAPLVGAVGSSGYDVTAFLVPDE